MAALSIMFAAESSVPNERCSAWAWRKSDSAAAASPSLLAACALATSASCFAARFSALRRIFAWSGSQIAVTLFTSERASASFTVATRRSAAVSSKASDSSRS